MTLLTYSNTVNFGFLANGAWPHIDALAKYTREAFDALVAESQTSEVRSHKL